MRKCKKCGAESNGKFCPECGAPIEEQASEGKASEAVTTAEPAAPLEGISGQPTKVPDQQQYRTLVVLAGSRNPGSYLNKGLSTILFIFGTLAMIVGVVLGISGQVIFSSSAASREYSAYTWYEFYRPYTIYTIKPEHFNKVILLVSLASFVISAGLAVWAVRKIIVYPELAKKLNGAKVNWTYNVYYEGLSAGQKYSVDAQCQAGKTYNTIRLLTYIGSAIIACCSIIYLVNAIGVLNKYYNRFDDFLKALIEYLDLNNFDPNTNVIISYCPGAIIAFLVILIVYDIIFVIVRKKLNAKACEQLKNVKF